MANTTYLPSYTIGTEAYNSIGDICKNYGRTAVVVGGKTAIEKAKEALLAAVQDTDIKIIDFVWYGGDSTYRNIDKVRNNESYKSADMVFAVGGGRAIDACKILTDMDSKPIFTFPTIASNCSPVTAVCVVYDDDTHEFKDVYAMKKSPDHCFINTKIIAEAPYQFFWAGIGDALSKQYETGFSARNDKLPHGNALGVQISRNCSDQLLQYGLEALEACKRNEVNHALEEVVSVIIISTGLVSVLVDLDLNSSLAHSIYYGCTVLPQGEEHLHGELVSYGILVLLLLDKQMHDFELMYKFSKAAKLPTNLADIGITTDEDLQKMLDRAMVTNDIKHVPYTITREMVANSIQELEAYNC